MASLDFPKDGGASSSWSIGTDAPRVGSRGDTNMPSNRENRFDLSRCVPMTRDEEHLCASEYARTRSPFLAAKLVAANMRLVTKIAFAYRRPAYDLADLVQEGNLGLVQAVLRYDPTRGVKLCSYAAWWIRAYILKYTLDNWRLVKAGTSQAQRRLFFNLRKQKRELEQRGIEPSSRNLAATMDVREQDVVLMTERFAETEASLDAPRGSSEGETRARGDVLGDAPAGQPDIQIETSEFKERLRGRLKVIGEALTGRELAIFQRRLLTDEPTTLAALAVEFGVSRERARQLEQRLMGRIRVDLTNDLGDALEGWGAPRAPARALALAA